MLSTGGASQAERCWPASRPTDLARWADELGRALLVSIGRPWRETTPGLTHHSLQADGDRVAVEGDVGPLSVKVLATWCADRVEIELTWRNAGHAPVIDAVMGIRLPGPAHARVTMPQVIYHDNPGADPAREVPHVGRGGFVTELHRLPIPAVSLQDDGGATTTVMLVPDADEDAGGRVRYGSLGVVGGDDTRVLALSGVTLFDGRPDVTYVHKARTAATSEGYRDLQPGESLRQRLEIHAGQAPSGHGFRELVRVGTERLRGGEQVLAGPLERERHIDLRLAALDARAFVADDVVGYLKFPAWGEPRSRPGRAAVDFLYGWTGQCLRLAWCDAWVGLQRGDTMRLERAHAACDFYVRGSETAVPGLRHNSYVHDDRRWQGLRRNGSELVSARAHGETMVDLADLISLYRRYGVDVPPSWLAALADAAELVSATTLPSGVVPIGWTPQGSPAAPLESAAGIPAAHAVAKAAATCEDPRLLSRAREMAEAYHELHGRTFDRPFAHSTLDAACEDKEGGLAYLELLMTLHDLTGDSDYLRRAGVVADWLLTWVYHWNPVHDRGAPLRERGFSAVGWPGVSVQNHHLDAFFPSYELWRLGTLTGDERLQNWGRTIVAAMGQGVCTAPGEWGFDVVGEQTEAFFVTNWQQRGTSNTWNPSWVIAHPLWQLLRFEESQQIEDTEGERAARP